VRAVHRHRDADAGRQPREARVVGVVRSLGAAVCCVSGNGGIPRQSDGAALGWITRVPAVAVAVASCHGLVTVVGLGSLRVMDQPRSCFASPGLLANGDAWLRPVGLGHAHLANPVGPA
jgi:hypothetical protein